MSSVYVRNKLKTFLFDSLPSDKIIDLTNGYLSFSKYLAKNNIGKDDYFIGIQYLPAEERPISIPSNNTNGRFREVGVVFIHVCYPVEDDVNDLILAKAEEIINLLRSRRIDDLVIEQVDPPNTQDGATLQFEGGYTSGLVAVSYYRDLNN